jgi:hypothetical protein
MARFEPAAPEEFAAGDDAADGAERPQTEAEAEQQAFRSELLVDRIQARLAREGEDADYEQILEEEIERLRRESGDPAPAAGQQAWREEWIAEAARAGEAPDDESGSPEELLRKHPLAAQALELAAQLMGDVEERGWVTEKDGEEHPVADLVGAVMKAGVKLAGALNTCDWPPPIELCAGVIVRLKKARVYLDDALRAMESCQEQRLTDHAWLGVALVEVVDLAHDADSLIAELRQRLEPGSD